MQPNKLLPDDFITISQAAKIIPSRSGRRLHTSTIVRWGKRGKITLFECNGYKVSLTEIKSKFGIKRVN